MCLGPILWTYATAGAIPGAGTPREFLGALGTCSPRRRRRDAIDAVAALTRAAARSPEHLVLLGRVEGQSTLEHREEEDPERPPVDGEVVGLGLCDVESERSRRRGRHMRVS